MVIMSVHLCCLDVCIDLSIFIFFDICSFNIINNSYLGFQIFLKTLFIISIKYFPSSVLW